MAQLVNIFCEAASGTVSAKLLNASTGSDVATAGTVTRRGSVWYECSFSGVTVGDYVAVVYDDGTPMVSKALSILAANGVWGDTIVDKALQEGVDYDWSNNENSEIVNMTIGRE